MKIACAGSSGTGKTTLSKFIAEKYGLPMNPVGSRSVAQAMGFESPYDVDKAGRREEFQQRLLVEKIAWEAKHESFVVDRTTADNLAYTCLHAVDVVREDTIALVREGLRRYTHIFYCPVDSFCNIDSDPSRVSQMVYHSMFDVLVEGLLHRYRSCPLIVLDDPDLESRKEIIRIELAGRM